MPVWLLFISSGAILASLVFKVIALIGIAFFTLVGVSVGLDAIQAEMNQNLNGIPINALSLLRMSGITTVIHWILAAYAFRVLVSGAKMLTGSRSRLQEMFGSGQLRLPGL